MSPRNAHRDKLRNARIIRHWTRQTCREIEVCIVETRFGEAHFVGSNTANVSIVARRLPHDLVLRKRVLNLSGEIVDWTRRGYVGTVNSLQGPAGIDSTSS